jgi:hypothetical protein
MLQICASQTELVPEFRRDLASDQQLVDFGCLLGQVLKVGSLVKAEMADAGLPASGCGHSLCTQKGQTNL